MNYNGFLNHLLSIALFPGIIAGVIPYYLLEYFAEPQIYDDHILLKIFGIAFLITGVGLLLSTVFLFRSNGKGTLAPWSPPRRLVIKGPYRYVRNPMIIGVISILIGEAFYFNSIVLLIWAMLFFVINTINFEFFEERKLERRFGESYLNYKEAVPRWFPRRKPYNF
ncbi:MAG: isoprenylcysteine carboxylmethyltransferase family protein [Flavobacteriaceae bacterium]|nr:isoprenylcysteine carboxylmethyltransferase family protein [Bacteroidia bacterium]NNF75243.1 isoprenylcysteine carboxylmethyltransferase family protein [Flavobacteriaceae bacterium]NNK74206.1 isoprenylcysteine carboxylmethyltransferase family protein [Flavobacteriaceae bacterium]